MVRSAIAPTLTRDHVASRHGTAAMTQTARQAGDLQVQRTW
eukprot:SAG11_NODE_16147_length_555_cov_10.355263_1_plen_40_part_10